MLEEKVWIKTKFFGENLRGRRRWFAVAMRGEKQAGQIAYSHSRKSVRGLAYAAVFKQPEEQR